MPLYKSVFGLLIAAKERLDIVFKLLLYYSTLILASHPEQIATKGFFAQMSLPKLYK